MASGVWLGCGAGHGLLQLSAGLQVTLPAPWSQGRGEQITHVMTKVVAIKVETQYSIFFSLNNNCT
jgi:hypothetical protein